VVTRRAQTLAEGLAAAGPLRLSATWSRCCDKRGDFSREWVTIGWLVPEESYSLSSQRRKCAGVAFPGGTGKPAGTHNGRLHRCRGRMLVQMEMVGGAEMDFQYLTRVLRADWRGWISCALSDSLDKNWGG